MVQGGECFFYLFISFLLIQKSKTKSLQALISGKEEMENVADTTGSLQTLETF